MMELAPEPALAKPLNGIPLALGAYTIWGLLPLYLRLVHGVPALHFVGWRTVFTLPVCAVIIALRGQGRVVWQAAKNPRIVGVLAISALLIGANWTIYISAVQAGHLFAGSLGYYINPLVNVLLGTLFLGERLRRRQRQAVALAGCGVAVLALSGFAGSGDGVATLAIALTLAFSFSAYGLVRKLVPVGSLPGLTIEAVILSVPAVLLLAFVPAPAGSHGFGDSIEFSVLIALSGVLTAVPLLLFAEAARRMDYSTLGFMQFLAPTLIFLLGVFVFHEPLHPAQIGSFVLIWGAIALFCWDMWERRGSV